MGDARRTAVAPTARLPVTSFWRCLHVLPAGFVVSRSIGFEIWVALAAVAVAAARGGGWVLAAVLLIVIVLLLVGVVVGRVATGVAGVREGGCLSRLLAAPPPVMAVLLLLLLLLFLLLLLKLLFLLLPLLSTPQFPGWWRFCPPSPLPPRPLLTPEDAAAGDAAVETVSWNKEPSPPCPEGGATRRLKIGVASPSAESVLLVL